MENKEVKTYYLVFKKTLSPKLFFLKKNFGHILSIEYNKDKGLFVEVDPKMHSVEVRLFKFDLIGFYFGLGYKILKVDLIQSKKSFVPTFGMASCLSAVKYILNYKCYCLTPYSFYKHLKSGKYKSGRSKILSVTELTEI